MISVSFSPAWATHPVPGHLCSGLLTFFQKEKKEKERRKEIESEEERKEGREKSPAKQGVTSQLSR